MLYQIYDYYGNTDGCIFEPFNSIKYLIKEIYGLAREQRKLSVSYENSYFELRLYNSNTVVARSYYNGKDVVIER